MPGVNNVVGSDGIVPVYNADGRWTMFALSEIFTGGPGANRYVPKIFDYVINPETFETWIVDELDPITLIPTLKVIRPANMTYGFNETDLLFGVGPGTQSDTYRVYLDKSVLPYVLAVDVRLRVAGSMTSYCKIFKGSVLNNTGHVVSKVYDSAGTYVSENVGLELVAIDSHVNVSIKTVNVCHTTEDLSDGEIVTVVFYSDNGHVVSKRQLLVENTSFIRSIGAGLKYVTHISLISPFLSPTLDHVIEYPLNIPTNALNLQGKVHYSNGETLTLPVDGTKFKMFGLEQFVSSIVGQRIDLVLSYGLSDGEAAYAGVGPDSHFITEPYSLVTVNPNNSYTVKLFGYPFWIDDINGYQMRWWLLNLDRNIFFDVTTLVSFDINTGPYDPKGYGYMQRKSVSINLKNVSGAFKAFVHTQTVEIVLNGAPAAVSTPWTVSHESNSSRPMYGLDLFAKRISTSKIKVDSDITDFNEWKLRMYNATFPLVNPNTEIAPINPTHFTVMFDGLTTEFPIAEWNQELSIPGTVDNYKTVAIRFTKRTGSGDLYLAFAALMIKS